MKIQMKYHKLQFATVFFIIIIYCCHLFRISYSCDHDAHHHNDNVASGDIRSFDDSDTDHSNTVDHRHRLNTKQQSQQRNSKFECRFISPSNKDKENDKKLMEVWKNTQKSISNNVQIERSSYNITVYFHIIQPFYLLGGVFDYTIKIYMKRLNNAFRDSPFVFDFKATTRTYNWNWANNCDDKTVEFDMKSSLKVGLANVLNAYICYDVGRYAGYAYTPGPNANNFIRDGVVVVRDEDSALTLIHEVVSKNLKKMSRFLCFFYDFSHH